MGELVDEDLKFLVWVGCGCVMVVVVVWVVVFVFERDVG